MEVSGRLEQLRAKVRAGIYDALEKPQACTESALIALLELLQHFIALAQWLLLFQETALPLSRDNLVINELIREYLLFNGYRNTLSVLLPGADLACPHLVLLYA